MAQYEQKQNNKRKKKSKKYLVTMILEVLVLLLFLGGYLFYSVWQNNQEKNSETLAGEVDSVEEDTKNLDETENTDMSQEELEAKAEQEKLQKELKERQNLIDQADGLALGYDYDAAIDLIKNYQGSQGGYQIYESLGKAVRRLEEEKAALVLYGGSLNSVTEINHIFFHALIADTSKAFDGDPDAKGYNMYMVTVSEFEKIIQKMYDQGYVLVNMTDLVKLTTEEDGSTKYIANEIYLREGKKPLVISEDDVAYYKYMNDDGFASRIVLGEDGNPTCEMKLEDGKSVTGDFDVVPIIDAFVEKHPDFSYKGAKGLIALTGYEGILGYRTNDTTSPTYAEDVEAAKKVVETMKSEGWEFGSHSWGHKDMQLASLELLERDTNRWIKEVGPLVGPTDIYVFPFGIDIEATVGTYSSDKYKFLKESGFNIFLGVYKEPWMHIKKDYVRMTRRPIDGQALLEFPDRLTDLFHPEDIIDPQRPDKNW